MFQKLFIVGSGLTFAMISSIISPITSLAFNDDPLTENWAPGEWGADDAVGAVNRTSPEIVLRAVGLVKQGKVATLGKVYQSDMPMYGDDRSWRLIIPGGPTSPVPIGPHEVIYNDEFVSADLGQVGTQFDGPGHIGTVTSDGTYLYNGHFMEDADINANGMGPLGVEHIADIGFVCRGVLLDAVALRGGQLPIPMTSSADDPGVITPADIEAMIERQGIAPIGEGDCVFLHTGHGNLWHPDDWDSYDAAEKSRREAEFDAGEPGYGIDACEYLADQKVILWGSDTWASEAVGPELGTFACHLRMIVKHGIWNLENLDLTQLVADKAYEFLFVWSPLKMKGATGSPGNPMALY